jgi:hypothetical protein
MRLFVKIIAVLLLVVITGNLHAQNIKWTEIEPGIWKGIIGQPEAYDLLKAAGTVPYHIRYQNWILPLK